MLLNNARKCRAFKFKNYFGCNNAFEILKIYEFWVCLPISSFFQCTDGRWHHKFKNSQERPFLFGRSGSPKDCNVTIGVSFTSRRHIEEELLNFSSQIPPVNAHEMSFPAVTWMVLLFATMISEQTLSHKAKKSFQPQY